MPLSARLWDHGVDKEVSAKRTSNASGKCCHALHLCFFWPAAGLSCWLAMLLRACFPAGSWSNRVIVFQVGTGVTHATAFHDLKWFSQIVWIGLRRWAIQSPLLCQCLSQPHQTMQTCRIALMNDKCRTSDKQKRQHGQRDVQVKCESNFARVCICWPFRWNPLSDDWQVLLDGRLDDLNNDSVS